MWTTRLMLTRHSRFLLSRMSTTSVVNPRDYLKSWLGSDLGASIPAVHATRTRVHDVDRHPVSKVSSKGNSEVISNLSSMRRLSLVFAEVDWSRDVADAISKILPAGSGKILSCFLNMQGCKYSEQDIFKLIESYKKSGYDIIATNVPKRLIPMMEMNGIGYITNTPSEGLTLHPAPSTQVHLTSTQINIPTTKEIKSSNENKFHAGTVRSGQQLYAEDCSLTVMGTVNEGGELLSDGDIYVFGKLRGRAVAGLGATDPAKCRIYVSQFEASLVGIKSVFIVPEDHEEYKTLKGRDVCISLEEKRAGGLNNIGLEHGTGVTAPVICSIDCDDVFRMVFRPFLS